MSMFDHTPSAISTRARSGQHSTAHASEVKTTGPNRLIPNHPWPKSNAKCSVKVQIDSHPPIHYRCLRSAPAIPPATPPPERRATFSPSGEAKRFEGEPRLATRFALKRARGVQRNSSAEGTGVSPVVSLLTPLPGEEGAGGWSTR